MPEPIPAAGTESDWKLLSRTARGDEEAFRRIVERHQNRLIRLCERLLQDREAALDAAQEVFLKAYRKAGTLQPKGELFTWLYRVATNHCLNLLRRRRAVRFLPLVDELRRGHSEPADKTANPEDALEARRRWRQTRAAVGRLPVGQRAVLVLAKFEGLSYREIADTLGITEGAVESRLFRALRNLERAQESQPSGVAGREDR